MYCIQVRSGENPQISYAVESGSNKRLLFDTKEKAYEYAEKLKNGASIGVWCKIEKAN